MATEDPTAGTPQEEPDSSPDSEEGAVGAPDQQNERKTFALSTESERAAMIASVLRDQETRKGIRALTPGPAPRPVLPRFLVLALSTVLAAYVWLVPPGWVGPDPVPAPPIGVEGATLRLEIFIQAQAIENYRLENGRTPGFLNEVGPPRPGITYRRVDADTYLLKGQSERLQLTYSSQDPLAPFLGSSGESLLTGTEAQ